MREALTAAGCPLSWKFGACGKAKDPGFDSATP
jgi:hypothetical protein